VSILVGDAATAPLNHSAPSPGSPGCRGSAGQGLSGSGGPALQVHTRCTATAGGWSVLGWCLACRLHCRLYTVEGPKDGTCGHIGRLGRPGTPGIYGSVPLPLLLPATWLPNRFIRLMFLCVTSQIRLLAAWLPYSLRCLVPLSSHFQEFCIASRRVSFVKPL
jgi:hypothetical protein